MYAVGYMEGLKCESVLFKAMSASSTKLVLAAITDEPCTPNEIAEKVKLNQKTVQTVLLELANSNQVRMKKIGRYRLFWKSSGGGRK
jgi:DNA-binding IclR family transcriptional regulator